MIDSKNIVKQVEFTPAELEVLMKGFALLLTVETNRLALCKKSPTAKQMREMAFLVETGEKLRHYATGEDSDKGFKCAEALRKLAELQKDILNDRT